MNSNNRQQKSASKKEKPSNQAATSKPNEASMQTDGFRYDYDDSSDLK
jgi:hypothetical protein